MQNQFLRAVEGRPNHYRVDLNGRTIAGLIDTHGPEQLDEVLASLCQTVGFNASQGNAAQGIIYNEEGNYPYEANKAAANVITFYRRFKEFCETNQTHTVGHREVTIPGDITIDITPILDLQGAAIAYDNAHAPDPMVVVNPELVAEQPVNPVLDQNPEGEPLLGHDQGQGPLENPGEIPHHALPAAGPVTVRRIFEEFNNGGRAEELKGMLQPTLSEEQKNDVANKLVAVLTYFGNKNADGNISAEQQTVLENNSAFMRFIGRALSYCPAFIKQITCVQNIIQKNNFSELVTNLRQDALGEIVL